MTEFPSERTARLALLRDIPIHNDLALACDRFQEALEAIATRTSLSEVTDSVIERLQEGLTALREESKLNAVLDGRVEG